MMAIRKICSPQEPRHQELRTRAMISSKARYTEHYVVDEDGEEVAFLSLDRIPHVDYLVLYEIFVPPVLRHQGIGSRVLMEVERIAQEHAYEKITVTPSALEPGHS